MKRGLRERGQVAVEYLLLLVVIITIFVTLSAKVKAYLLGGEACSNNDKSIRCRLMGLIEQGQNDQFRYFPLMK